jgi:uncharacterized membrane protein YozB (DUF420 family)
VLSTSDLPAVNASLNAISTIFISAGWYFIRRNFWQRHVACMITAIISSTLFLVGYVTYHAHVGEKSSGYRRWLAAGISASLGQTSSDRKMDDAYLAVCLRHRRLRLPDALSLVSAAESCTAALNVVCS